MNPIEVTGLRKVFNRVAVLDGLNLSIPTGSIYGLFGRNGAGKTTLLRCLIGLMHPNAGQARVLGATLSEGCPPEKAHVAYVAQGEFLPSWARIEELIRFESELRPVWNDTSLNSWMKSERLSPDRAISELSVGQRQRLELEFALAAQPKVMIMDEPFGGLDPISRIEFIEQVLGYAAEHETTIVLSSHILSDLERMCDRVGLLAKGIIAYEADMDDLKDGTAIVTSADPNAPMKLPCNATQIATRPSSNGRTWVVSGLASADADSLESSGLRVNRGSLEELGVELIRCLDAR